MTSASCSRRAGVTYSNRGQDGWKMGLCSGDWFNVMRVVDSFITQWGPTERLTTNNITNIQQKLG